MAGKTLFMGRLSHNRGSHAALVAGLAQATGDCAVLLAADLQDPPEILPELLAQWEAGNDVVWAKRRQRPGESRTTRFCAASPFRRCRPAVPISS
jgi:polyisoprenyl-phosphate glycosyltransferase